MGNTWITNISHFLDDDGKIPELLPRPALRLANYFGSIVKAVTARRDNYTYFTDVQCRRRPGHKRCEGEIIAFVKETDTPEIVWCCPGCDDQGIISGWSNTIWDHSQAT